MPGAEADAVADLTGFFSNPESKPIETLRTGTDDAPVGEGAVRVSLETRSPRSFHADAVRRLQCTEVLGRF